MPLFKRGMWYPREKGTWRVCISVIWFAIQVMHYVHSSTWHKKIGRSGVRILCVLLRRGHIEIYQCSLPLGSSWFYPFIIYILQNLSVYGLCLRVCLPELVWLLVSDLFYYQRLGGMQNCIWLRAPQRPIVVLRKERGYCLPDPLWTSNNQSNMSSHNINTIA